MLLLVLWGRIVILAYRNVHTIYIYILRTVGGSRSLDFKLTDRTLDGGRV